MQLFWLVKDFRDFCLTSFQSFAILVVRRNKQNNKENNQPMKKINLSLVLAVGLCVAALPAAGQSVLISINQANPAAVTFTTTGLNSFANSSVFNLFGVDLVSYFTIAPTIVSAGVAGTLTPAGTTTAYTQWIPDNQTLASFLDLNLYDTSNPQAQTFVAGNPAFTGVATINLSSLLADLPSTVAGHGNIYSGNISSPGVLIGTWVVVPEPSVEAQLALGAMVIAGLALVRRARRVAARQ